MARNIQARIIVTGKLVTMTPLHVGGYDESFDTDLPLARDGAGDFYVPGTSLAGPLRAWCLDVFDEAAMKGLWGFQEDDEGHASFVTVEDAAIENFSGNALHDYETEVRDGIGIYRKWGVAANQFKFDRAILPRGSKLDFQLRVDIEADKDKSKAQEKLKNAKARIGHLLQALSDGDVPFGAAKTRGLGRVCFISEPTIQIQTRNTREGILNVLRASGGNSSSITTLKAALTELPLNKPSRLTITIGWRPRGALMVKSGADGIGVDMLPLVSGKDGDVALVLSGSSVKGALRSHAERIARTVKAESLNGSEGFDDQLTQISLIAEMFGAGKPAKNKLKDNGRIGALAVMDCYAEKTSPRDQWEKVTTAKEKTLLEALENIKQKWEKDDEGKEESEKSKGSFEQAQHVAIDRWTGGAADSMLFSVLEPYGIKWEPLVLTLDLEPRRHAEEKQWDNRDAAVALLFLLLRDLVAGRVPLGFAVNRGMGEVAIESIKFTGRELKDDLAVLMGEGEGKCIALNDGDSFFEKLGDMKLLQTLNDAWQTWR